MKIPMIQLFILMLLILHHGPASAQTKIEGKVIDSRSGESLPGASVTTGDLSIGTVTDGKGGFTLRLEDPSIAITVSYIGYETRTLDLSDQDQFLEISLAPSQ